MGSEQFFKKCLKLDESIATTNTQGEFVAMCGVTGLGKFIYSGKQDYFDLLRKFASDKRWRVREGVTIALQLIGEKDFRLLIENIIEWKKGNPYEKRAVVAGLCEPSLLKEKQNAEIVLKILNEITNSIEHISDRKNEPFRVLRKGLGYGLSVAIVAYPENGKKIFENLRTQTDKDIRWILNEN